MSRQRVFDGALDLRLVLGEENAEGVVHHCSSRRERGSGPLGFIAVLAAFRALMLRELLQVGCLFNEPKGDLRVACRLRELEEGRCLPVSNNLVLPPHTSPPVLSPKVRPKQRSTTWRFRSPQMFKSELSGPAAQPSRTLNVGKGERQRRIVCGTRSRSMLPKAAPSPRRSEQGYARRCDRRRKLRRGSSCCSSGSAQRSEWIAIRTNEDAPAAPRAGPDQAARRISLPRVAGSAAR